ncbi:hypothetical protein D3C85_1635490 [compost metagenome]
MTINPIQLNAMINVGFERFELCKEIHISEHPFREFLHVAKSDNREHIRWNVVVKVTRIVAGAEAGPYHSRIIHRHA